MRKRCESCVGQTKHDVYDKITYTHMGVRAAIDPSVLSFDDDVIKQTRHHTFFGGDYTIMHAA